MSPEELRLELVKICYRHDLPAEEITARTCKLEEYVLSSEPLADAPTPSEPTKKPRADKAKAPA